MNSVLDMTLNSASMIIIDCFIVINLFLAPHAEELVSLLIHNKSPTKCIVPRQRSMDMEKGFCKVSGQMETRQWRLSQNGNGDKAMAMATRSWPWRQGHGQYPAGGYTPARYTPRVYTPGGVHSKGVPSWSEAFRLNRNSVFVLTNISKLKFILEIVL